MKKKKKKKRGRNVVQEKTREQVDNRVVSEWQKQLKLLTKRKGEDG